MDASKKDFNQGAKKLTYYLDSFINSDEFQEKTKGLRMYMNIPPSGLVLTPNIKKGIINDPFYFFSKKFPIDNKLLKNVNKEIHSILKKIPLAPFSLGHFLLAYILLNKKIFEILDHISVNNLCKLVDTNDEYHEYCGNDPDFYYIYTEMIEKEVKKLPIAIRISPYASLRDINDFIKNNSKYIRHYQEMYKKDTTLGKVKTRKNSLRDEFIYKNRNLPRKELSDKIKEKFGIRLDSAEMGKIISIEKKRRKKV